MKASSESGECASVISITLVAACLVGMGGTRKTEWRSSVNRSKKTQVPGSALDWGNAREPAQSAQRNPESSGRVVPTRKRVAHSTPSHNSRRAGVRKSYFRRNGRRGSAKRKTKNSRCKSQRKSGRGFKAGVTEGTQ